MDEKEFLENFAKMDKIMDEVALKSSEQKIYPPVAIVNLLRLAIQITDETYHGKATKKDALIELLEFQFKEYMREKKKKEKKADE
jgi:hypothetical protein